MWYFYCLYANEHIRHTLKNWIGTFGFLGICPRGMFNAWSQLDFNVFLDLQAKRETALLTAVVHRGYACACYSKWKSLRLHPLSGRKRVTIKCYQKRQNRLQSMCLHQTWSPGCGPCFLSLKPLVNVEIKIWICLLASNVWVQEAG